MLRADRAPTGPSRKMLLADIPSNGISDAHKRQEGNPVDLLSTE